MWARPFFGDCEISQAFLFDPFLWLFFGFSSWAFAFPIFEPDVPTVGAQKDVSFVAASSAQSPLFFRRLEKRALQKSRFDLTCAIEKLGRESVQAATSRHSLAQARRQSPMLSRSIALALCKRVRLPERAAPAFVQIARLSATGSSKTDACLQLAIFIGCFLTALRFSSLIRPCHL